MFNSLTINVRRYVGILLLSYLVYQTLKIVISVVIQEVERDIDILTKLAYVGPA